MNNPLTAALEFLRDEIKRYVDQRITETAPVPFTVATTSPFRVYLAGNTSQAIAARAMAGWTPALGESGIAFPVPGDRPVCVKTT